VHRLVPVQEGTANKIALSSSFLFFVYGANGTVSEDVLLFLNRAMLDVGIDVFWNLFLNSELRLKQGEW
jgi:hypothetical protein